MRWWSASRRPRSARHRLLQRRHRRLASPARRHGGELRPGRLRQPRRRVQRVPVGRARDARARERRPHRRHVVRARPDAVCRHVRVRGDEGGAQGDGRDDGDRARAARDHGQPHRAGLGPLVHQRRLPGAPDRRGRAHDAHPDPGGAARRAARDGPCRRLPLFGDGDYVTGEFLRVDGGFVVGKY